MTLHLSTKLNTKDAIAWTAGQWEETSVLQALSLLALVPLADALRVWALGYNS